MRSCHNVCAGTYHSLHDMENVPTTNTIAYQNVPTTTHILWRKHTILLDMESACATQFAGGTWTTLSLSIAASRFTHPFNGGNSRSSRPPPLFMKNCAFPQTTQGEDKFVGSVQNLQSHVVDRVQVHQK